MSPRVSRRNSVALYLGLALLSLPSRVFPLTPVCVCALFIFCVRMSAATYSCGCPFPPTPSWLVPLYSSRQLPHSSTISLASFIPFQCMISASSRGALNLPLHNFGSHKYPSHSPFQSPKRSSMVHLPHLPILHYLVRTQAVYLPLSWCFPIPSPHVCLRRCNSKVGLPLGFTRIE